MDSDTHHTLPQAARLAPKLHALADRGVYFGTSSWKYDGWIGSIYREDRYLERQVRGKLPSLLPTGGHIPEFHGGIESFAGQISAIRSKGERVNMVLVPAQHRPEINESAMTAACRAARAA
jgi:hypothetical protein